jgi:hypothetical protein
MFRPNGLVIIKYKYSAKRKLLPTEASVIQIAHLQLECHSSKFGIFELLVWKETFADVLLTGIVL